MTKRKLVNVTSEKRPAEPPVKLSNERLEIRFEEFKTPYKENEAITEAERCLGCFDAPCISACPTQINIPQFISRIAQENFRGAAKTILEANVFGESCGRVCPTEVLCEGACVYHRLNGKPIGIGRLQQFAVRQSYDQGHRFFKPAPPSGKKVALIGAGAASIACAHRLRVLGHEAVIFEKTDLPGGLNTSGIAPYKMKAAVSVDEIEQISSIGIEYQFNRELGVNLQWSDLFNAYDAVFLGMGLGSDHIPQIMGGEDPEVKKKVFGAVEFVSDLKTKSAQFMLQKLGLRPGSSPSCALVIGGGNTALDICRELRQLGISKVVLSYRRSEAEMSGYAHELSHARNEGVETLFNSLPFRFENLDGRVKVVFQATGYNQLGELTTSKDEFSLLANLVFFATGQLKLEKVFSSVKGLEFKNGKLFADPLTGQTGHPQIFAGGDLVNGGLEVVNAVAEGKRAAFGIDQFLMSKNEVRTEGSIHV